MALEEYDRHSVLCCHRRAAQAANTRADDHHISLRRRGGAHRRYAHAHHVEPFLEVYSYGTTHIRA